MAKTIQAALAPLFIIGAFCSLCIFEYPLGRPRPYLTCLYFLIVWSTYTYIVYLILINMEKVHMDWTIVLVMISSFGSMIISLFRFKELKSCLRELSIVDDTLEVLGTPKEYQRLYKWMIGLIIAWVVSCNLLSGLDVSTQVTEDGIDVMRMYLLLMEDFQSHVSTLNGMIFGIILGYVSSRFERVNKHIGNLLTNNVEHDGSRNTSTLFVRKRVLETEDSRRIWIIMHVHLQLSALSRKLNKVFEIQLTLQMACLFKILIELFIQLYSMYAVSESAFKDMNILENVVMNMTTYVWIIMLIIKLLALNHVCQMVCDKANETIGILYNLSNNCICEDSREQVLQFILQIKQREVKFSAMGLFYFGNNFIRNFFTSMLTICLIIIQMSDNPNKDSISFE